MILENLKKVLGKYNILCETIPTFRNIKYFKCIKYESVDWSNPFIFTRNILFYGIYGRYVYHYTEEMYYTSVTRRFFCIDLIDGLCIQLDDNNKYINTFWNLLHRYVNSTQLEFYRTGNMDI